MRRLLSGIPRPRFRVRTLLVLVALSAVALWGAKIVQDGPSTRWQILKFRHGSPATRREILDELHTQSVRGWFGGLFGLDNGNHLTGEAKKVEGRRRAALWIPALFEATEDADPRVRAAAIRTLAMVVYLHGTASEKNAALQRVIRATADRDAVIREHAVHSLIDFTMESPTKVLPVLREALHDPVMPVRRQAVEGLRFVGIVHDAMRAEMASELARILGGRDHPEIRAKAAWGLGLFAGDDRNPPGAIVEAVPSLILALQDEESEVRRAAAEVLALASSGSDSISRWAAHRTTIVPALMSAWSDPESAVRHEAALGLFRFGNRDSSTLMTLVAVEIGSDRSQSRRASKSLEIWRKELAQTLP